MEPQVVLRAKKMHVFVGEAWWGENDESKTYTKFRSQKKLQVMLRNLNFVLQPLEIL